jgi:hypothetical protein
MRNVLELAKSTFLSFLGGASRRELYKICKRIPSWLPVHGELLIKRQWASE